MMSEEVLLQGVSWLGGIGVLTALCLWAYWIGATPTSLPRVWWTEYVNRLQQVFKTMHDQRDARRIAQLQLGACLGAALYGFYTEDIYPVALMVVIAGVPWLMLRQRHQKRLEDIDNQLEGWLLALANGLKAAPSIGDAIEASVNMTQPPLRSELDVCVKEMRLGTPVDQAITNFTRRIQSTMVTAATTAILIGRQTGGDLSVVLERAAGTLREMKRLDGVVRAKTAEGRNQAYVLAAMPFVLLGIIHSFDPTWFEPLLNSTLGYVVIAVAMVAWLCGIIWARKIMSVDI